MKESNQATAAQPDEPTYGVRGQREREKRLRPCLGCRGVGKVSSFDNLGREITVECSNCNGSGSPDTLNLPPTPDTLRIMGTMLGEMLADKNARYGSAFMRAPEFLAFFFPDGIPPEKYPDIPFFIWIFEKLARIAACPARGDVEDPCVDIAGFGVLWSYMWPKHRTPTHTHTEGEPFGPGHPSPVCSEGVPCCRIKMPHKHVEDRVIGWQSPEFCNLCQDLKAKCPGHGDGDGEHVVGVMQEMGQA